MARLAVRGIVGKQYTSPQNGNSTLSIYDLDTASTFRITLQKGSIDGPLDELPRQYILDGVEQRRGDKGDYYTCTAIYDGSPAADGKKPKESVKS